MILLIRWLIRRYRTRKQNARLPLANSRKDTR